MRGVGGMACEARDGVHWVRVMRANGGWQITSSRRCKKLLRLVDAARQLLEAGMRPSELTGEFLLEKAEWDGREKVKWQARVGILLQALRACQEASSE